MTTIYLYLKAFHVIAVIAWMAGMLYLPRLFVYHCDAEPGSKQSETFTLMERRLLRFIMTPAVIVTWAFGLWLATSGGWSGAGWLHVKIALVVVMSGLHGFFAMLVKQFAAGANRHTARFYRILNELVTILLIAIVLLAVVKPF